MRFYEHDIKEFDEILRWGLRAKVVFNYEIDKILWTPKLLFISLWFLRNVAFRLSCETLIIILRNFYVGKTRCYRETKSEDQNFLEV